MQIRENEVRLWIEGVPKSEQNKGSFTEYTERIQPSPEESLRNP